MVVLDGGSRFPTGRENLEEERGPVHFVKYSDCLLSTMQCRYVCLEMFNCLQAEQTIAIRKRNLLNKFIVISNVSCQVFVVNAKKELESCCTNI